MDIKYTKINFGEIRPDDYCWRLGELAVKPRFIYVCGTLPKGGVKTVAIVGTRRPTPYGRDITFKLAYELAKRGIVIISGLAYGIDAVAHRAAIEAGGVTIAVLAGGGRVYPAAHTGLARQIIQSGGAIISEFNGSQPLLPHLFLARNRLVSGLADAVVVTEAAERSGTLSTVNHALEQGREVFAVPGNINSLLSVGPNRLIQQGATPVLSVESILEVIAPELIIETPAPKGQNSLETSILTLINKAPLSTQDIKNTLDITTSQLLAVLSTLEVRGEIRSMAPDSWSIL